MCMYVRVPMEARKGTGSFGAGVISICEPSDDVL